jgi:hypothetical protein
MGVEFFLFMLWLSSMGIQIYGQFPNGNCEVGLAMVTYVFGIFYHFLMPCNQVNLFANQQLQYKQLSLWERKTHLGICVHIGRKCLFNL